MPSLASARTLHEKFNFLVIIKGADTLRFQKASELSQEVAKIDYWEGGALIPIKHPGRVTLSDITLERGVGLDQDIHDWMLQVADVNLSGGIGAGQLVSDFTREVSILQQNRPKTGFIRKYKLFGAWPTNYVAGDWDNSADEVVIETLTLTYDQFRMDNPTARKGVSRV